jgi:hypothetical protein
MRLFPSVATAVLCAASVCAAHAKTASSVAKTPARPSVSSSKMSFAYDGVHGITSTGVQLSPTTLKADSVSPTTGKITVTINIAIDSRFEPGTTYHCSVYAIGGEIDLDTGPVDGGIENVNGIVTGSGRNTSCTMSIPYSWTLPRDGGADTGLILAFGAAAVNTHGEAIRSTLQVDGIENLPASGSVSKFVFNVAL